MDARFTAEEHYRRGCELLALEKGTEAFELFRAAHELDRESPRYASYYGLGLALVSKIVADHGGMISCDSAPGLTVFRLLMPVEARYQ